MGRDTMTERLVENLTARELLDLLGLDELGQLYDKARGLEEWEDE